MNKTVQRDPVKMYFPTEHYDILAGGVNVGAIRLRIADATSVRYIGHIGYDIHVEYRRRGYATQAIRQVARLARRHSLAELWITIHPDNIASQKACLNAGATYLHTVLVPNDHDLYDQGFRQMQRYRLRTSI
ncbi:GNAT family N-acetyltransferase [Novosphingobium terrae]|uniref:GNAT family N-acetyltransferase n=1 Tax=Novosphingobium terrae TaxID=2726189 RepID=UPI00198102E9|nr:GNAT family N-acetyltransferase [Novosphingobium terrae]